jgi:hydrogenase maturation protein HypF
MTVAGPTRRRVRVRVTGTVQGVGYRPFVHRLANSLGVTGWVRNDERGVLLEAEGDAEALDAFVASLHDTAPPLAEVESVAAEHLPCAGAAGFAIVASASSAARPDALVTPDSATCADCLRELFDPADRRYRYPFVNCTNCGPRFTIVRGVPYDRSQTTMSAFDMCRTCRAEYEDPTDRRFHAQPNACPVCGPAVRLVGAQAPDPVAGAAAAIRAGAIVAVKGLGGFHLACRADDEGAVARLRARKHREDKPFALMVRGLDAARRLAHVDAASAALLEGHERPIVLMPRRAGAPVAGSVAPRSADLGIMLPYTPLHHLLLTDAGVPVVLTSGNVSDEPIAHRDDDALGRLAPIADLFLLHDRPIHVRTDDSVARAVPGRRPLLLRRSRGYVPSALALPLRARRPVLACGAELKSTFCVARDRRAWVSHHVGDLVNLETLAAFSEGVEHFERLFAVTPEVVAHDLHPDYLSTTYALAREDVEQVAVQHHHAHLAAVLAEHGETGPAIGVIFDGAGLGTDGTVWGGELLIGDLCAARRAGQLHPVRLPGGDRAAREPWRMARAWLMAADAPAPPTLRTAVAPGHWRAVGRMIERGVASPITTSAGRLFDAVAALCGIRLETTYEGQAAVELEAAAARAAPDRRTYPLPVTDALILDARPTVAAIAADAARGVQATTIAARFHRGLADATIAAVVTLAEAAGVDIVALGGGVFANRLLTDRATTGLEKAGLHVLLPERLPPGDGAISYGQAAVAAARDA